MKLKQKLIRELKKTKASDWFKALAIILIIYCGVKIFLLFYASYIMTLVLAAAFLEEHGKTEFTKQLPTIARWSTYYLKGLVVGIVMYIGTTFGIDLIKFNKKSKTKRRVK